MLKKNMKIANVAQVASWRLCLGCGACFYACKKGKVQLINVLHDGIRPIVEPNGCEQCNDCLRVCPGVSTIAQHNVKEKESIVKLTKRWGNIIEIWEGYASNKEIRYKGSSGGLCTALSLFCLEKAKFSGVIQTGAAPDTPWKNKTYFSKTKEELLLRTGSRYSPASPCDRLDKIEKAPSSCVFIGKPCDVAGLRMASNWRTDLEKKTSLAVGFFCAGTPSTQATLDLFKKYGADPEDVDTFRYRGMGWPGMATIVFKDKNRPPMKFSYNNSWGFIQKYRPFRCYLCPDLTAEFADISVGDPWYRELGENDPGRSLILIRTKRGQEIFHQSMEKGYVTAEPADLKKIYRSQKNLLAKRQAIWGRLLVMRMMGIPYPNIEGFQLFGNWMDLPFDEKLKSIFGTFRRIIQRNYFKPLNYS